jgi:formylglycine-generating enzyme required for sulfatase activity
MGRSEDGTDADSLGSVDEQPEHDATVADFYLDAFEVTVGRFRRFVDQYDGTPPSDGSAAHPLIASSGWQASWNPSLPVSQADLVSRVSCASNQQTWTDTVRGNETYPMNCIDWYVASAFCAWDEARLPTEAEWEYAAAGGNENRLYAWGSSPLDATLANSSLSDGSPRTDVGSHPAGVGRWNQRDLCGSLWEWTLDGYSDTWYANGPCVNCAQLGDVSYRAYRGGSFSNNGPLLRVAKRGSEPSGYFSAYLGIRCARDP